MNLMTNEALEKAIDAREFPRVTKAGMEARIKSTTFMILPDSTVTICNITLDNGYSVRGEAACVDKRNFNIDIGQKLAYDDAFRKLWPLFGFLLAENTFSG